MTPAQRKVLQLAADGQSVYTGVPTGIGAFRQRGARNRVVGSLKDQELIDGDWRAPGGFSITPLGRAVLAQEKVSP